MSTYGLPETHKPTARSPLRYPGGKTRGIPFITRFIPEDVQTILSPFLGGGAIELHLAAQGKQVYGYDVFTPLAEFWQCLLDMPRQLAAEVKKFYPLPKEHFYKLQQTQTLLEYPLQRAAVFFVLNRSSFSGSTLSGGMSPGHPRFTLSAIERVNHFYNPNIRVAQMDFRKSLAQHPEIFAYLDPPYLVRSALYGKKGDTHRHFDHEALAAILHTRNRWLLSYNDSAEIRALYEGHTILTPCWKYGMSADKQSKEILVFSKDFKSFPEFY